MKEFLIVLLSILSFSLANAQSLIVFGIDTSSYPTIKGKFYAFDTSGNQLTNINKTDFGVKEGVQPRTVSFVSCPSLKPPAALSSVLVIDVSGSMCGNGLDIAKGAANAWIDLLPLGRSECAITSFSNVNYINQDFTTNKAKLIDGINSLSCIGGTNYDAAMLDAMAGGVLIAKTGKNKRVIVFLSDGNPNSEPQTAQIISQANANNITIYCVTIGMPVPQCMKDFANQTGGLYFENIRTKEEAEDSYRKILMAAQGGAPCQIEWLSGISCLNGITNVEVRLLTNGAISNTSYQSPSSSVAKLEFNPVSIKVINALPGIEKDTTITVTARNANFTVTNITSSNAAFTITPTNFNLNAGQSRNLTVGYVPADSGYAFCKFTFENDLCQKKLYASGGFPGKKPAMRTLKLIVPNGGEVFVVGSDTVITWEGVLPEEKVTIDFSINNGLNWSTITDSAIGLSYLWRVPKTPSNRCIARVTAKLAENKSKCTNEDAQICNQIWMGCNLDVDTYRNGDPIPEVQDATAWSTLTIGAWCYYNNDPALGAIYGKLYNWYAVNDPRGLAPLGWHVPTDTEWKELEMCLGMTQTEADKTGWRGTDEGGKLKSTGTIQAGDGLWDQNTGATNSSGFSALPGGIRNNTGLFGSNGTNGCWWADDGASYFWFRGLSGHNATISRVNNGEKEFGLSVRCVRD